MVTEAFVQYGVPALAIMVSVAASWALHKLADFLHAKAQAAAAENQRSLQTRALQAAEVLANCAADGVIRVENTLRPTIRDVTSDGRVTLESAQRLRDEAIRVAWAQAKACYGEALKAGGFDTSDAPAALTHLIEAAAAKYAGSSRAQAVADKKPAPVPAPA